MNSKAILLSCVTTLSLCCLFEISPAQSQWSRDNRILLTDSGVFMGGMGFAFIDDKQFFVFNLRTELSIGQFALGIDAPLRFNVDTGTLRDEDWDDTYDYFRLLRYIRYGNKRTTPVYTRVGTLDAARLGHGFIMNYYTNELLYDDRKIGLEFDLNFDMWGFESVVSNFERLEIIGGRGYVRPLRNRSELWVLKNLTFGATLITDRDPDKMDTTSDDITIGGVDVEMPLLNFGPISSLIYADFAKIQRFGSGQAVGLEVGFRPVPGVSLQAKIERRFLGKNFLPSYFNPFYESERFRITDAGPVRKADQLSLRTSSEQGTYGELFGNVFNLVKFIGTFERIDGLPNSGRLHLAAILSKSIARITAHGAYDKTGIEDFSDTFTLNDRSIARLGLGYQVNPYIYLYMDYIWTFEFNETTQRLDTQRRVEPQLTFVFPIDFARR